MQAISCFLRPVYTAHANNGLIMILGVLRGGRYLVIIVWKNGKAWDMCHTSRAERLISWISAIPTAQRAISFHSTFGASVCRLIVCGDFFPLAEGDQLIVAALSLGQLRVDFGASGDSPLSFSGRSDPNGYLDSAIFLCAF